MVVSFPGWKELSGLADQPRPDECDNCSLVDPREPVRGLAAGAPSIGLQPVTLEPT
jgi:hypothetical protein